MTAQVTITNDGTVRSPAAGLLVSAGTPRTLKSIPELAPGKTYATDVEIVIGNVSYGREPCDFDVTATADFGNQIDELDEQNNTDTYDACCK
jgi:subtilase family serine protease